MIEFIKESLHKAQDSIINKVTTLIDKMQDSILSKVETLNPIPESIRPIIGSRYFWFVIWIAAFSALGRNLLGGRIGNWVGLFTGGALWYYSVPNSITELTVLVVILIVSPFIASWLSRSKFGCSVRGLKICPDCAEEVKSKAKVCKYCAYLFDTHNPRLAP